MASLTSSTRRWRPGSKSPGACPGTGRDREGLQRHLGEHARRLPQGLAAFFLLVPARWLRSPASGLEGDQAQYQRLCLGHRRRRSEAWRPCPFGCDHRAAAFRPRLELYPARPAVGPRGAAYLYGSCRHSPRKHAKATAAERGGPGDDLLAMIATLGHDLRACATALFCSWAVAAACGAPRSSVSTSCATTTAMAPAGSRFLTARAAGHPARQDRLARGRGRPRLQRPHLPRSRARELDPLWPHRTWTPVPPHLQGQQDRRRRTALRQARRPPGQAGDDRRRRPLRSPGRVTGAAVLGPVAARRTCLVGRRRGALHAEAARPCLGRDDPQISAEARQIPDQPHQGVRALRNPSPPSAGR